MDDNKIIELYCARNENALKETENKYSSYLMFISMNILNNIEDGSECVNDTYFRAWNSIPPDNPVSLKYFLGKITRRLSIDRLRRKFSGKRAGSEYELSLDELMECVPNTPDLATSVSENPENRAEVSALALFINDFINEQKEEAKDIFVMRYYFCDSIKRIAYCLGVSEGKVKSSLFRTRESLRKRLEKEGWIL